MNKKHLRNIAFLSIRKFAQKLRNFKPEDVGSFLVYGCEIDDELREKINWYLPGDNSQTRISRIVTNKNKSKEMILLADQDKLANSFIMKNLHRTEVVDPRNPQLELGAWWKLRYYTLSFDEKKSYQSLYQSNYSKFLENNKQKNKAYLFGTGPSISQFRNFNFEDNSLKVICNSIVKNHELLEYIGKPDLLVFADPLFHFSTSGYARQFREDMLHVVNKYDCFLAVPDFSAPLLIAHYPEIEEHIIGVGHSKKITIPTEDYLSVLAADNIFTYLMLPMGSAIADEICMLGMDGRAPDDDYFWQHDKSSQYGNQLQKVKKAHPYFFISRNYSYYYMKHCKTVKKMIRRGERRGKRYCSLAPSNIPALGERTIERTENAER